MGCATLAKVAHIRMCSNNFGQVVYICVVLSCSLDISKWGRMQHHEAPYAPAL